MFAVLCGLLWIFTRFQGFVCYDDTEPEACAVGGVGGACVPLPACAQYAALLKNSDTLIEGLQLTQARQCGFEGNNMKVCCPGASTTTSSPTDPDDDFVKDFPMPGGCGITDFQTFMGRGSTLQDGIPLPPPSYFDTAITPINDEGDTYNSTYSDSPPGNRPYKITPIIAGGRHVDYKEQVFAVSGGSYVVTHALARWMALLGYRDVAVTWQCGGTVITARHVLTAAHCIKRSLYVVRLGELDLESTRKQFEPLDILVKKTILHEEYTKFHNDIALVVLQETIDFANNIHIHPICLAAAPDQPEVPDLLLSKNATITGWGETEIPGVRSNHLLYADVRIRSREECAGAYARTNVTIDARVLCAGDASHGRDACKGDSGGPLFTKPGPSDFYFQLGVVSYGYHCQQKRYIGVYTNVTHYMPWLEEKVLGRRKHWT